VRGMALAAYAEQAAAPLDRVRRTWLGLILRSRTVAAVVTRRDRRIATLATVQVAVAFAGALYFPVLLFVLGPILLGVAHVAADVRYLVLRRRLESWWQNAVWAGCAALVAIRVVEELGLSANTANAETLTAAAFVGTAIFAGVRGGGSRRRAVAAAAMLTAATLGALSHPTTARLVFVHAHNLIALVLWVYLFARRRAVAVPVALVALGVALLASGALSSTTLASPGVRAFGLHAFVMSDWVAPFDSPRLALGVACAYVFLQSVHYGVWLSFVPQEELQGQGTLTFRMSARSLFTDLGTGGVAAVVIAALAVIGGAYFGIHRARSLYLSLAMFHGYLELALLAFFFVRREAPVPAEADRDRPEQRHTKNPTDWARPRFSCFEFGRLIRHSTHAR
jgi:hypothetical protein